MMKILLLALLFSLPVSANYNANSGAVAVVCEKAGKVSSVELLDLFEARMNGLTIQSGISSQFEVEATKIFDKFKASDWDASDLTYFKGLYKQIDPKSKLVLTPGHYPLQLPRGCGIQQITFVQNSQTIWIDTYLYNQLDNANRLAVFFHDFLYYQETLHANETTDSRYTRTIVGLAFSTKNPFSLPVSMFKMGTGTVCMDERELFMFVAKKKSGAKKWEFSFISINNHLMYAPKKGVFELAYDPKDTPSGSEIVSAIQLESEVNPGELMTVRSSKKGLFLSWKGTYPGSELKDVEVSCKAFDLRNNG